MSPCAPLSLQQYLASFLDAVAEASWCWSTAAGGSDEALCAWLYFLGTIVAPFYCLVFVISEPTVILHWAAMILSALAAVAMCYFIVQAYHRPHPEHPAGTSTPCCKSLVVTCWGSTSCCVKHVATNQLAVSWAFFLLSLLFLVVGFAFCFTSQNQLQAFVFISGTVDSVLWTISSAYFVAGSYVVDGATDKTMAVYISRMAGLSRASGRPLSSPARVRDVADGLATSGVFCFHDRASLTFTVRVDWQ
eukprot:g17668.t1